MAQSDGDVSGSDQDALIQALIEDGYAVEEVRSVVRAYIRDSHRAFDVSDYAMQNGYVMTGFKNLGRKQEFLGYVRLHPADSVGVVGYIIEPTKEGEP